uniref:Uncharacterized protein n=1 Tax=Aegilops tauschii subsp. strangulata TaxID=200361 RepID=A0A452ZCJ1_AEGTS
TLCPPSSAPWSASRASSPNVIESLSPHRNLVLCRSVDVIHDVNLVLVLIKLVRNYRKVPVVF